MAVGLAGPATVRRSNGSENGSRQDSPVRMVDNIRYVNQSPTYRIGCDCAEGQDLSCDETPVGAVATDDGFVIVLVYGLHTDWLKNVLASGSATIVNEGHTYRVDQPEVIPMEAAAGYLSANDQRNLRLIGANQCLRLRRVEPGGAA